MSAYATSVGGVKGVLSSAHTAHGNLTRTPGQLQGQTGLPRPTDYVRYGVAQDLTEWQRERARDNIQASSLEMEGEGLTNSEIDAILDVI